VVKLMVECLSIRFVARIKSNLATANGGGGGGGDGDSPDPRSPTRPKNAETACKERFNYRTVQYAFD